MNIYKKVFNFAAQSRKFQIMVNTYMKKGEYNLPIHMGFGHEFVSSLVRSNFNMKKDVILLTHRNIHYTSIFSKNAKKIYNNFKKKNNVKYPSLGSMNFLDNHSPIKYTSSILGNNLPVACGVAEAQKNERSVVVCVTGDGAIEEGTFYESLILSKYLNLRIIFLVENNNFSMATNIKQRRCEINLKKMASSIGLKYYNFKRDNIIKNIKTYSNVVKNIRKLSQPVVCEFEVKTLGNILTKSKVIHYHHGPMKLDFVDDILLSDSKKDIIYLIKDKLKKYL